MDQTNTRSTLFVIFLHLSVLNCAHLTSVYLNDASTNTGDNMPKISWLFSDSVDSSRYKRAVINVPEDSSLMSMSHQCRQNLNRLCGGLSSTKDELMLLECIQSFKPTEVSGIDDDCRQAILDYVLNITNNTNIERLARRTCGQELDSLHCSSSDEKHGAYLSCLIDKREEVKNPQCIEYIQRLEWIAFSDFRIITPFSSDCENDIKKFKCDKVQPYRDMSQGQILACLQEHVNELQLLCKRHIFHVSEIQAENINLDRQLYLACEQDRSRFCPNVRPGSGQVYKCLMQHKTDRSMTTFCQEQLTRRGKLIASDYRVSKGLVKACKDDIKMNHCRRSVVEDKNIRLAQILLCLESAAKNGSKIDGDCQAEMFDHRKMLMEDYRLSPEIVDGCANDITTFCNSLEIGGATIHCLMEHTRTKKKKSRVTNRCQRALEDLIMEADAGEDWRIDPVLREQCQSVVNLACRDVHGGDARVISCLMEQLGTGRMTEACETALVQIQYFVARDFKLDPQLYRACKFDASHLCHARNAWANDGKQMDPERGPLVLPCLYRHAYHPQKNMTLKTDCLEEIRRVMRQRAVNVDLQPEIEEVCLNELASLCYDKTAKGEEILCLQDNLDRLNRNCKLAVGNFTEEQAERIELNPIISAACQHIVERHCEEVLKYGKDEGDMMECLIEHKNDLDVRADYKCKAAVEHFQLISLKNYHFTYKFKEACRPSVKRWCPKSKTKAEVIECLSTIVQEDTIKDTQHHVSKECRQQLRAQLYQQRENIHFDPILQSLCSTDIKQYCYKVEPGNSQVLECLAAHKSKLSDMCHKQLFKVRKQEFQDSSSDFALLNGCRGMVKQFCHDISRSQALDCLKRYKDEPSFDDKCKNIVIRRMIEQNTDYRFNTALQAACSYDINKHCKEVLLHEPTDKELEGKVIRCLKIKFREDKLMMKCQNQMINILKEAALNYNLNPLLATMCAHEIETICRADENDPGAVEECLKLEFNNNNKDMKEGCRMEIANIIEERRADINVDPLLQRACAIDVNKYCSDVPQGAGRHIMCLQNVLENNNKPLNPDCYKMLTTRIEMFQNAAAKVIYQRTRRKSKEIRRVYKYLSYKQINIQHLIISRTTTDRNFKFEKMESDYEEDRGTWTEEMGKAEDCGAEDSLENPQEILNECLDKFKTPDYIMEPGIFTQLKRYFQAGGNPEQVIELLSKNYTACAQMANLLAEWLILAGVKVTDVQAMVENNLKDMILKTFDPKKADKIFTEEGETPAWLTEMIQHPTWRSLIYRLAEEYPDCLMLNFTIKLISDAGFQGEITSISTAAQQIEVFSRVLKTAIAGFLQNTENWQSSIQECAKMVCHGQHTYVYSQVLLQILAQEPRGGFMMKRLSQEITKCAQQNHHDVTPITMALNGASGSPSACQALVSMLSRNALNPADISVLFRNYSTAEPPPIELIRNPQFLELLVDALFKPGVKINPEHKSKYIYLLAYAASVCDIPAKKGHARKLNKDELKTTIQAIEKVHSICNINKGSTELIAELQTLYQCIRFPVVSVGVIRWVECTVTEASYFKLCTEHCPLHLALLDEVVVCHALLHSKVLQLLVRLFESKQDELEILVQLEMKKMLIDRMVNLLSRGCVVPVVCYIKQCWQRGDTDVSLIRYFVTEVLEAIAPPYTAEFIQLFLPMVEDEEITGTMRGDGDNDLVSEFIVHCKAHCPTIR